MFQLEDCAAAVLVLRTAQHPAQAGRSVKIARAVHRQACEGVCPIYSAEVVNYLVDLRLHYRRVKKRERKGGTGSSHSAPYRQPGYLSARHRTDRQRRDAVPDGFKNRQLGAAIRIADFSGPLVLRLGEQNILSAAALAYMNVLRDTAILDLDNNNVSVLQQQLKQTQDQFGPSSCTRVQRQTSASPLATEHAEHARHAGHAGSSYIPKILPAMTVHRRMTVLRQTTGRVIWDTKDADCDGPLRLIVC